MSEWNLSDKLFLHPHENGEPDLLRDLDVREFIRRLKEALKDWEGADNEIIFDIINRLAGEKLSK